VLYLPVQNTQTHIAIELAPDSCEMKRDTCTQHGLCDVCVQQQKAPGVVVSIKHRWSEYKVEILREGARIRVHLTSIPVGGA
jgi:hypothetical protein